MSPNLFDLHNKVALITGGASGMGKATAFQLANAGAKVVIADFNLTALESLHKEFTAHQFQFATLKCDASLKSDLKKLHQFTRNTFGTVDILVTCAGIAIEGSLTDITEADLHKTFTLNVESALWLTQMVIPEMQQQQNGALIYLASLSSVRGNKKLGLYGMSKATLAQMARNIAVEYGPDNIRANAISPGVIETHFSAPIAANETAAKKRKALTPLRRFGKPDEVAGMVLLIASKAGGFITGQNLIIDGGTTISDGN